MMNTGKYSIKTNSLTLLELSFLTQWNPSESVETIFSTIQLVSCQVHISLIDQFNNNLVTLSKVTVKFDYGNI